MHGSSNAAATMMFAGAFDPWQRWGEEGDTATSSSQRWRPGSSEASPREDRAVGLAAGGSSSSLRGLLLGEVRPVPTDTCTFSDGAYTWGTSEASESKRVRTATGPGRPGASSGGGAPRAAPADGDSAAAAATTAAAAEPDYKLLYQQAALESTVLRLKLSYFATECRRILSARGDLDRTISTVQNALDAMMSELQQDGGDAAADSDSDDMESDDGGWTDREDRLDSSSSCGSNGF
ncbi:unnamed protein product [Phaeothamnion confervicola]